jgi:DNA invertase Pin-like site-specific DNA recombinase
MPEHSTGQTVGYVRVSSLDQNTDRQLDGQQLDRSRR